MRDGRRYPQVGAAQGRIPLRVLPPSRRRSGFQHIIAKQHGGGDGEDNLCLSCADCNWAKGTNLAGRIGERLVPLYHPRRQVWKRHFRWENTLLIGKTRIGQVTVQVLGINDDVRVMLRENLLFDGRFPPED